MLGKLSLESIPHDPIVLTTLVGAVLGGLGVVALITKFKLWGYLWKEWFASVDHKKIGVMYLIVAFVMLLRGFSDAIMMRTQQALAVGGSEGYLPPHHYDQIFTAHGVIMIFFVAMPLITGLMNLAVPLQIGARDVAFPFVNSLSFWLFVAGAVLIMLSLFTWTALVTNVLIVAAFPVLTITLVLLTLDRYLGTHFFTNDGGGNAMLYINLIWIWGHPEVYILVLPAFGVFSEVIATFSRKALFGYKGMVYATACIGVLSFIVWLHHFFTMGSGANVNAFFGITTMIISIPTGVKIFNWLFTMFRGRVHFTTPVLWTIGFMVTFVIGGMTGVMLAIPAIDFVLYNSLFLIAHFHNVIIGGVVFGMFAGITYWWPKMFGFRLNEFWGKCAFWCWFIGFYVTFMPMYVLGFMGMTRRLQSTVNPAYEPLLLVAACGAFIVGAGILCQIIQVAVSIRDRKKTVDLTGDPWDARTLEWETSSPPAFYNFATLPDVTELDDFWERKQRGEAWPKPAKYTDIHMPRNTGTGVVIGAFSLVFGFAMIWHIWWLAIVGFVGMIATFIYRTFDQDVDYWVPAAEVERIENAHRKHLEAQGLVKSELKA